ncbi:MAG: ABC transporter ATP-binding protein [Gammaproteobacteria bacterium]|nr:ABC transporter ATP-binding protein [Gammaproteobacteria bacterium]
MEALIEVNGLSKDFGSLRAVKDLSLKVYRGEVLGFLGPNGAGKSTTMKMITGFLAPTSGSVSIAGFDIEKSPIEAKARIGYLPEGAPAYGEMTPIGFLEFIADIRGMPRSQRNARITEVVSRIHLESVLHQRIETLSKGFKRRVGLAQAILHDPEILIMDEPTDGLDPNQKHEVRSLIQEMAADKAIVISTHILEEVDAVCTRAIIIGRGEIIFSGTPRELASRSRYNNAATIVIDVSDIERVRSALRSMSGVQDVEESRSGDEARITVIPEEGANPAVAVQQCLADIGCNPHEFFVEHGRLDEVFRSITTTAADGGEIDRT